MTRYIRVSTGGVARRVRPAVTPTDHHTFPTSNVRTGEGALPEDTVTGDYNTATGADALTALIGGHSNVAVGESAMIGSTNAVYNVAVGRDALGDATSSSYNVAVGYLSMNDTGNTVAYNVAIGVEAGEFVNADGTVAVGSFALMGAFGAGATVSGTVAVGYEALQALTSGAGGVAVGYQSLYAPGGTSTYKTTTGARQTAVGYQTGQSSAVQRNDIVAVGYQALVGANDTVALGSGAQALHANAVALGKGIVTTAASQVATGLTHWEVGEIAAPGTPAAGYVRVYANSNSLWTIDEAGVSTDLINAVGSHTVASHSDTTATGAELESLTDGSNADALHDHDHGGISGLTDDDHTQYPLLAGRAGGQTLIGGTGTTDDLTFQTTSGVGASGADMHFLVGNNGATEALTILNSGLVGIGSSAPLALLSINGPTGATNGINVTRSGWTSTFRFGAQGASGTDLWITNNYNPNTAAADSAEPGYIYLATKNNTYFYGNGAEVMRVTNGGQVGIGATTLAAQLHVDQSSATAAIPVLILDQADDSEEMIEFIGTIGTGNAIEAAAAKTLTTTHFIKVTIPGGLTRYLPVGTIA